METKVVENRAARAAATEATVNWETYGTALQEEIRAGRDKLAKLRQETDSLID